jgi:2-(1,2-epoxy-1,2-dihydrophenyl)acetyl-CoA isomerase
MTDFLEPSPLLFECDGSVARLTLNRPESGNAITLEMAKALVAAADRCDTDEGIRCVVLTGSDEMFCVGGDIGMFAAAGENRSAMLRELADTFHMAISTLARMRKPLLVLVNGPAAGAGLSLALLGDIVLATPAAHFTVAFTAIGLSPDSGSTWLLPRLVGLRNAQEMILTNRRVGPDEAQSMGLITRVINGDDFEAEGGAMIQRLTNAATGAIGAARALLLSSFSSDFESQMECEARSISVAGAGDECREGVSAFLEKRKPNFKGNA